MPGRRGAARATTRPCRVAALRTAGEGEPEVLQTLHFLELQLRQAPPMRLLPPSSRPPRLRPPPLWLIKYEALLASISKHAPIDLAKASAAGEVHYFPHAIVSLRAHRELIIERELSADGLTTPDFTHFVRHALSLPRNAPTRLADDTGRKPRLDEFIRVDEEAGFESDVGDPLSQVDAQINSADVLVRVHGAGLTNMMFLPPGVTLIQVVPWGGLQWIAHMDYGDPAEAMGLRYIQYEIGVEESSLKDKYPRDHEIFTNPTALRRVGVRPCDGGGPCGEPRVADKGGFVRWEELGS